MESNLSISLSIDLNSIYYLPDWVCHPTIIDRSFLFRSEHAEQAGRAKGWRPAQACGWAFLQQRDFFERSEIEIRCSRCEAPKPYISNNNDKVSNNELKCPDNLNDGTEDTNHNGRIDGDNGDGIYGESETWSETSPNLQDSDGDFFSDKNEIDWGYNPLSNDTDNDGLLDNEEDKTDSGTKGFLDSGETDPTQKDTDGDELNDKEEKDGWKVVIYYEATGEEIENYIIQSDPRDSDTDNDGLNDMYEYQNQTDPTEEDTDGDGKTDIQEITGDFDSSPTGIDGEPPEIWHYDCQYKISYTKVLLLKVPSGLEVWMEVGARDIFGLDNIEIFILGLENKKIFTNNEENVTVEFKWKLSGIDEYKRAFLDGFKINVTATDRNNNIGYRNEKLDSIKDIVVSAFLGALLAIVDFIAELFNFLFDLIISLMEAIFTKALDLFLKGLEILFNPVIDILVNIGNGIFNQLSNKESTKWEYSFGELASHIMNLFTLILLGSAAIIGIKVAYVAFKTLANVISGGGAESITTLLDTILCVVCPAIIYGLLGAVGGALVFNTIFEIFDGSNQEGPVEDFVDFLGLSGDIADGAIQVFLTTLYAFGYVASQGKAGLSAIKGMLFTGEKAPLLWITVISLFTNIVFKTGIVSIVDNPTVLFIIDIFCILLSGIACGYWIKLKGNPLSLLWDKIYQPVNVICDLLLFGMALGNFGIFIDNIIDKHTDIKWWD